MRNAQMISLAFGCGLVVSLLQAWQQNSQTLTAIELGLVSAVGILILLPVVESNLTVAHRRSAHWADRLALAIWCAYGPMLLMVLATWSSAGAFGARLFLAGLGLGFFTCVAAAMRIELPSPPASGGRYYHNQDETPDLQRSLFRVWPAMLGVYFLFVALLTPPEDKWLLLQLVLLPGLILPLRERDWLRPGAPNIARLAGFGGFLLLALLFMVRA